MLYNTPSRLTSAHLASAAATRPPGRCTVSTALATCVWLTALLASRADAQLYMGYSNEELDMQTGDFVDQDGVPEHVVSAHASPLNPNQICTTYYIPIQWPIGYGCDYSYYGYLDSLCYYSIFYPIYYAYSVCTTIAPPPAPPMPPPPPELPADPRTNRDLLSPLEQVIQAGDYALDDLSTLPSSLDGDVTFGIPLQPLYGRFNQDYNGVCPSGMVKITGPSLAAFGETSLCVQTTSPGEEICYFEDGYCNVSEALERRVNRIGLNADTVSDDINDTVSAEREAFDVLTELLDLITCKTTVTGGIRLCLRRSNRVDSAGFDNLAQGLCPVEPNPVVNADCMARGEQTPVGCSSIACIEALNAITKTEGITGCAARVATIPLIGEDVGLAICELIRERDHYYLVNPKTICTTADSPRCSPEVAFSELIKDVRNQAPGPLQGKPINGIAQPKLQMPVPISEDPNMKYYLGPYNLSLLRIIDGQVNTSNPVTITLNRNPTTMIYGYNRFQRDLFTVNCSYTATNITDTDHLLQGTITNCIYQEGNAVKSLIVGQGANTRNSLLNELVGPSLLGATQDNLRRAVQSALIDRPPGDQMCRPGECVAF